MTCYYMYGHEPKYSSRGVREVKNTQICHLAKKISQMHNMTSRRSINVIYSMAKRDKKDFWKNIYKSKDFRTGVKDWFVEMIQDYVVFPIVIIGIIYLSTLI